MIGHAATSPSESNIATQSRGYVAVVNRSQKDINDHMTVREGLVKENVSENFLSYTPMHTDDLLFLWVDRTTSTPTPSTAACSPSAAQAPSQQSLTRSLCTTSGES